MRIPISNFCMCAAFLVLVPTAGFAAEKSYLCAINEVYECAAVTGCSRISLDDASRRHSRSSTWKEAAPPSPIGWRTQCGRYR